MVMPKVYLAGPINGIGFNVAVAWRKYVIDALQPGVDGVSPMRIKEAGALGHDKAITARNRLDLQAATLMLANLLGAPYAASGTAIEFGWADAFRIPVVMVIEASGNPYDRPMIREIASFRVTTLEEGINLCKAILS